MPGVIIPLFNRKTFNFTPLQSGLTESQVIVKAVSSERYREGLLVVRAHTRDIGASCSIALIALTTAPSSEDPSLDFVATTASGTATVGSGSTLVVETATLANFGGFLRINLLGTRGAANNCTAVLSADLILKE